uniref:non-specific serine/threonine protein kinase n=1 Tax=Fagus sylvatica TaxID=28930 RepID=A0A2N9FK57_FAGSY
MSNSDKLSLTVNGLTVTNQAGKELWSTPPLNSEVAAMQLSETGNLVLVDVRNVTLWESFDYPTDTIVMGQHISAGKSLESSVTDEDLSVGDYRLEDWEVAGPDGRFSISNFMTDKWVLEIAEPFENCDIPFICREIGLCTRKPLGGTCSCPPGFRNQISGELEMISIPGLPRRFAYEELVAATENFKTQYCAFLFLSIWNRGSLDSILFGNGPVLEWQERVEIALGTARGLAYLHSGCEQRIIHCDVKPENILLHDNLQVKISDFGISKLLSHEQSTFYTALRGTRGYLAPEWLTGSPISDKADVYSYGMVLLEIVTGRKNCSFQHIATLQKVITVKEMAYPHTRLVQN